MSYADAQLDLACVSIACLSGQNGAGKSAILDAVTWSLWEEARASSDELIRLGEREMWVEVLFLLDGQNYRVRRSRQKGSERSGSRALSKGTLELQVERQSGWLTLTAPSIRETQEELAALLRMDYETFANSVYLRQGRADEFTTRLPSERKQILGEILGLSYFDQLQELAKDKARQAKSKAELLEASLKELPELESAISALAVEQGSLSERAQEAADKASFYESRHGSLTATLNDLNLLKERHEQTQIRIAELAESIVALEARKRQLEQKLSELGAITARAAEIETAAGEFSQVKDKLECCDRAALAVQDLIARRWQAQSDLANLRSRLEVRLDLLRSKLAELEKKHKELTKEPADLEKLEKAYRQYKDMVARESELAIRQEAFTRFTGRADELYSAIQEARIRLEAEREQKEASCKDIDQLLLSSATVSQEKEAIEQQAAALDKLEAEFELVEQKGFKVKSDLEAAAAQAKELERRKSELLAKVKELEEHSHSSICPLCSAPIVDRLAVTARYRKQVEGIDHEISTIAAASEELEAQRLALRKQYTELRKKLDGRKMLDEQIGRFNEKLSSIERARATAGALGEELASIIARLEAQDYAQVERESLINIKSEIHKLDFDPVIYANLQAQIRMQRHAEARYQQAQRDLAEGKKLAQEIPALRQEADDLNSQIALESYGNEARDNLKAIQIEIDKLGYDRAEHEALKEKLSALIPASEDPRALERARSEAPELESVLESLQRELASRREQLQQAENNAAGWQKKLDSIGNLQAEAAELEPLARQWRFSREDLSTQLAVLKSRMDQLTCGTDRLKEQKTELDCARLELSEFQALAEAFGKKGIQAVIIENAIPEIESEANRLLSKLSDNQMHVALNTRHRTKSGGTVETLDLLIGDELGTRNYELYSGGEAFKVNFAVRIALAKLLARRAGAKLETLILDEGFGSQDELSRDRLVQVIGSIKDDFARILIITHIAEVKEMFPTQIQVTKQSGLSKVEII
jgi:exonuclease SbcC